MHELVVAAKLPTNSLCGDEDHCGENREETTKTSRVESTSKQINHT